MGFGVKHLKPYLAHNQGYVTVYHWSSLCFYLDRVTFFWKMNKISDVLQIQAVEKEIEAEVS